jgi:hypothetical protein
MIEESEDEAELAAFACAGLQRVAALPNVAECHAGSNAVKRGSASEARIAEAQRWWRCAAEERFRRAIAMIDAQARRIVTLAQHAMRKTSADSELASVVMVSSPFGLSK